MEMKEFQYFFEGLTETVRPFVSELYDTLLEKGKRRMGQETSGESPQVSELIRSIGGEVKKILSSAGIVTRTDLARVEKRIDEIEKTV